ncbi:hypothetical protein, partial [Campylobacter jejuni]|uniref:hypothetical protein n=1 Tax=Campylobacter jejuni TaxID=197 RepID=UPI003749785F
GERKDICWRSPGRNGGMEQRHLPAFETGRAGKGQKLCAGYCPCGASPAGVFLFGRSFGFQGAVHR